MKKQRLLLVSLLVVGLVNGAVEAKVEHPSIGVCTRKEEFAERQAKLDEAVLALRAEEKSSRRRSLVRKLVKRAEADIECLIRYREPDLTPVLVGVVKGSKLWHVRTRALYALKMIGDASLVQDLAPVLDDRHEMVRAAAALTIGHWGGDAAERALEARLEDETDPHVGAALTSALAIAGMTERPWDALPNGTTWTENLVGVAGARRVQWDWTVKGKKLFNTYEARAIEAPETTTFVYPIQRYEEDLFAGYPRNSFGAGGTHAGEDCAWFRDGCGIHAIADGVVRMVQGAGGDWGFLVAVEHRLPDDRYVMSVYGHMAFDLRVRAGDVVRAGQVLGTQGLSCSVENGGYGAHLHFGLGDGPFRRPARLAIGDAVGFDPGDGSKASAPVLRLGYSAVSTNSFGWPLTTFTVRRPDGTEQTVEVPEQPIGKEVGWFQAYVGKCRGWLNPQTVLPDLVRSVE